MTLIQRARSARAIAFACAVLMLISALPMQARSERTTQGELTDPAASALRPAVRNSVRHDTSKALKELRADVKKGKRLHELPLRKLPKAKKAANGAGATAPTAVGTATTTGTTTATTGTTAATPPLSAPVAANMPGFGADFEGVPNVDFVLPPDTNGDIGPNHYMQWVNLSFQVFDRSGAPLLMDEAGNPAPRPGNSLFAGFGGICEQSNDGDPIVQYDHLADRWMVSQFALFAPDGFHQCIAVSQTADPTLAWHRYDFLVSATKLNDYPHFGVWPDAYYMSVNQFDGNTFAWAGAGAAAFERDRMLAGEEARMVFFDLFAVDQRFGGQQPSDLDGTPPPVGTPNYFMEADDDLFGFDVDALRIWEFHVDWADPASSTFGLSGQPNLVLPTDPFDMDLCGFDRSCIPQPGTSQGLDAISDRIMYRLQFRNFGAHQTLVTNHTVDAGVDHAGVRWYELRRSGSGAWTINQQGTHAPDADHRWMASAAMDASGNIALGYSVSGPETFPSIRVTGRLAADPLGTMTQGESELIAGTGSQTHPAARWGDYTMMAVDSVDDCTFWYTNEYLTQTSTADWRTRVGSFRFPSCTTGPRGTLQGTVRRAAGGAPIEGARVDVGASSTFTDSNGAYRIIVPAGTYDVSASAYGFAQSTATGVVIGDNVTVTRDFSLTALPEVTVSGTVRDGSGHGWPLYARIDIHGFPGGPVFTNPVTGAYSVRLFQSTPYTFRVRALAGGYIGQNRVVTIPPGSAVQNFSLLIDPIDCSAPGYTALIEGLYEPFAGESRPPGWEILDNRGGSGTWTFSDPANRGNLTGGEGPFAIIDSDFLGPDASQDTELRSPSVNLKRFRTAKILFRSDYFDFGPDDEIADVDVSVNGGATWTNVWRQTADRRGPRLEEIDISAIAARKTDVRVRFHYHQADFAWWWEVDDVVIGSRTCIKVDGGLAVGHVTDLNNGAFLDGAVVTSNGAPQDTATTGPTPADPAVADGFYVLFSRLTGSRSFTASKASYSPDTDTFSIVRDGVVRHDFSLGAGILTPSPTALDVPIAMGGTADRTLTLGNTGTAGLTFEIRERDEGREILSASGAQRTRVAGQFKPGRLVDTKFSTRPKKSIHPPNSPPWVDIADYPVPIMDNTADLLEGKLYSVAGIDGNTFSLTAAGYVYDPAANAWSPIASLAIAREKPAAAFIGDRLYVVGGWTDPFGEPAPELEIYDPSTDTWSSGAPVPTAYAAAVAVQLDGQLYVIGGCTAFQCGSTDVFRYDPAADSWSPAAAYPVPVSWTHCGPIDGLIYCAGGVNDFGGELTAAFAYDPAADAWSPVASLPQTRWAGGYSAPNGQLLVSGGVTNDFQTITNEGFAYDPASDAWSPIANSNNVVYRGGSACGFYKVGGSIGGFDPAPVSERLPDLEDCGGGADVPWLSEVPVEGAIATGGSTTIAVHFDASVPEIDQPGDYRAQLSFREDTPYATQPVSVTMRVSAPASWGKLAGTVAGLARCDAPGGPLAGAIVTVDGTTRDFTLKTAPDGSFGVWMDAANSPLSVTVAKAGYVGQNRTGLTITAGATNTQEFELRLNAPCAAASPGTLDFTVQQGSSASQTLTLDNDGAAAYAFDIDETLFEFSAGGSVAATPRTRTFSAARAIGPASVRRSGPRGNAPAPAALPAWLGGPEIPAGIVRYAHAQCDGDSKSFYVIGGVDGTFSISTRTWRYDATTNTWAQLARIPTGGEGPTAVCNAGRIHVLGGDATDRHFIYDIATDSWRSGAAVPRPVWGAAAAAFNGRLYLAGGAPDFFFGRTDRVDVYDVASDTWLGQVASMPTAAAAPGYAQAGPYLYVVGGFGANSPDANLAATQRYDMRTDTWAMGPDLGTARADLALAATDTALYAIAGDLHIFEGTAIVERLATGTWPGAWAPFDPLGTPQSANNAGFCTDELFGHEIWSVGGLDSATFSITGRSLFHDTPGEACPSLRSDVPWLSEAPSTGSVPADGSQTVEVTVDATDLAVGEHHATLLVSTTEPGVPEIRIPVTVTVEAAGPAAVLYFSLETAATVGGVAAADEDILAAADDGSFSLYFDGSDVGLGGFAIDAFARSGDGSLLLSFTAAGTVPGAGAVDDSDIVRFTPTSLGDVTAGSFTLYFDGSDVGLTQNDEDVDALDVLADGRLVISTTGSASVPGASADDSDLLAFLVTSTGSTTAGTWSLYFDGSDVGLTTNDEDVDAVAVGGDARIRLSMLGAFAVTGLSGQDEDVAVFIPTGLGTETTGSYDPVLAFDGSAFGLAANDVSAIELP